MSSSSSTTTDTARCCGTTITPDLTVVEPLKLSEPRRAEVQGWRSAHQSGHEDLVEVGVRLKADHSQDATAVRRAAASGTGRYAFARNRGIGRSLPHHPSRCEDDADDQHALECKAGRGYTRPVPEE